VWGAVIVVGGVSLTIMGLVSTRMLRSRRGIEAPQVRSLTAYQGFETAPSFSPDWRLSGMVTSRATSTST
jgi:hypothetical protein